MPQYSYLCHKCGHEFDGFYRIDDRKIPESEPCPACQECGQIVQTINCSGGYVDAFTLGRFSMDPKFTQRMKDIRKANPNNTIKLWKE